MKLRPRTLAVPLLAIALTAAPLALAQTGRSADADKQVAEQAAAEAQADQQAPARADAKQDAAADEEEDEDEQPLELEEEEDYRA